MNKLQNSVG